MSFKKDSKTSNIILGVMAVLLFFISFTIAPTKVDHNKYKTVQEEYESNTKILETKSQDVNKLKSKLDEINKSVETLSSEVENLKQ